MKELRFPSKGIDVDPFPRLIWKYRYDFNKEILLPKIRNLTNTVRLPSSLESGNAESTVSIAPQDQPHRWPELNDFYQWLSSNLDEQWHHHDYTLQHQSIGQSWFNIHRRGGKTEEHYHSRVGLVATCYINLPADSGFIEFRDPLEYAKTNSPQVPEENLWRSIPCQTNDVLIFPGYLRHRTQANNSDEDRIVYTINII